MKVTLKLKDADIEKLVKQVCILYDTREQENSHILKYFDKKGIEYKRKALKFCDYSAYLKACPELGLPFDVSLENVIAIERKGSGGSGLTEIAHNFGDGRSAFENEWIRAKESGANLYLIIENGSWEDIKTHKYNSQLNEKALYNSLLSFRKKYGFQIDFIKTEDVGEHIYKLIGITLKKLLEE